MDMARPPLPSAIASRSKRSALQLLAEHDLFGKPVSAPDQVRGKLFSDHAPGNRHTAGAFAVASRRGRLRVATGYARERATTMRSDSAESYRLLGAG